MTRRKAKAKRRSQRSARQRASNRLKSQEPSQPTTGELITSDDDAGAGLPMETRSDQRFAARLISLGIVSEEETERVLAKAFQFAANAEKPREYATSMRVITAVAKLESDHLRAQTPHQHVHVDLGKPDGATADATRNRLASITRRLATTDVVPGPVPAEPSSGD